MCGRERSAELMSDFDAFLVRQAPDAPEQRRQILAVHELHREKLAALGFAEVGHAADIRVRDPAREADFL